MQSYEWWKFVLGVLYFSIYTLSSNTGTYTPIEIKFHYIYEFLAIYSPN